MKDVMVEIRNDGGGIVARMDVPTYLRTEPGDVPDGDAQLVFECPSCRCHHDLGTMDEIVAAFAAGRRASTAYSDSCVMRAARGPL